MFASTAIPEPMTGVARVRDPLARCPTVERESPPMPSYTTFEALGLEPSSAPEGAGWWRATFTAEPVPLPELTPDHVCVFQGLAAVCPDGDRTQPRTMLVLRPICPVRDQEPGYRERFWDNSPIEHPGGRCWFTVELFTAPPLIERGRRGYPHT